MSPEEIIKKLTVVHRDSQIGVEYNNFYTPSSTHRVINELVERINKMEILLKGKIPNDLSFLDKDIDLLPIGTRMKWAIKMNAARELSKTDNIKVIDILTIGRQTLSRSRNIGPLSIEQLDKYLEQNGITSY